MTRPQMSIQLVTVAHRDASKISKAIWLQIILKVHNKKKMNHVNKIHI